MSDLRTAALAQQAEPRNQCRSDGRCQYAIDHGAEGMGHCPKGKCVMAQHTQPAEDRAVAQSNLRVMKEMFREQAEPAQDPTVWVASKDGRVIYDDVSTDDGLLRVSGDFENDEQRISYAKQIVDKLNAAPPQQAEPVEEPAYKVKVAGRWHDTEPLAPAFSLPDGEHLLYTAPRKAEPVQEPVACSNTFACQCSKHFASQQSEQRPKRVLTAVWRDRAQRAEAQRDALLEALKEMLHRDERNTCRHEETHRGGAIWEICDSCGAMWADDEGGKPEWEDPKEWTQARAAIKAVKEGK